MSDDLHFSRSGTTHFGKLTGEVKTRLSEDEKADLMRAARLEAVAGKGPRQGPQGDGSQWRCLRPDGR